MAAMDRTLARALVDAGYMPVADYIAKFGDVLDSDPAASLVPDHHEADHQVDLLPDYRMRDRIGHH